MQIKANNISVGYSDLTIIKDLDLQINSSEIVSIIGPNGCGKTTLLKALTGLLPLKSGEVLLDEKNINEYKKRELARKIGMLAQKHAAPPDFKVRELVSYGRLPYLGFFSKLNDKDNEVIEYVMKAVNILDISNKCINEISGGQLQRVWLATLLAQEAQTLFLDEPTTYLDIAYQLDMMNLVEKLKEEEGKSIVMVLHDVSQAVDVSDKLVVIHKGKKISEGNPVNVITGDTIQSVYNVHCDLLYSDKRVKPIACFRSMDEKIR